MPGEASDFEVTVTVAALSTQPQTYVVSPGPVPKSVTIPGNRNIVDLIADVKNALNEGLERKRLDGSPLPNGLGIDVSVSGPGLLFTLGYCAAPAQSPCDVFSETGFPEDADFQVTAAEDDDALGLLNSQATNETARADITIVGSDQTEYPVSLDDADTIGDVISAIATATGGDVRASLMVDDASTPRDETGLGLVLTDMTFDANEPLDGFRVATVNGSRAGLSLGIVGFDRDLVDKTDVADGVIEGTVIAGPTLSDRLFFTDADSTDASNDLGQFIDASVVVIARPDVDTGDPEIVSVVGDFGFVGIDLAGTIGAELGVSLGFNTGTGAPAVDGRVTLTELTESVQAGLSGLIGEGGLFAPPLLSVAPSEGSGADYAGASLELSVQTASSGFTDFSQSLIGDTPPQVTVDIVSAGDPFLGTRLLQAGYSPLTASPPTFTVQGDLRSQFSDAGSSPALFQLSFSNASGDVRVVEVSNAAFANGETTVDVDH